MTSHQLAKILLDLPDIDPISIEVGGLGKESIGMVESVLFESNSEASVIRLVDRNHYCCSLNDETDEFIKKIYLDSVLTNK